MSKVEHGEFRVLILTRNGGFAGISNLVDYTTACVSCRILREANEQAIITIEKQRFVHLLSANLVDPIWISIEETAAGKKTVVRGAIGPWVKYWTPPNAELPMPFPTRRTWPQRAFDRIRACVFSIVGIA